MPARALSSRGALSSRAKRGISLGMTFALLALAGCAEKTGALTADQERQFASEGITRRAADLMFRYTRGSGTREATWEDRKASIVVTRQRVYIHKNEKVGLEITPRTRRFVQVRHEGNRVRISAGGGRSAESWSFIPPSEPEGWTRDIRAVSRVRP